MASVYILYSSTASLYYVGSTKDLDQRIEYHDNKEFTNSFTAKYEDWELFYSIDDLEIGVAQKIESHIKRMKSTKYYENLKKYPEISQRLIQRYLL